MSGKSSARGRLACGLLALLMLAASSGCDLVSKLHAPVTPHPRPPQGPRLYVTDREQGLYAIAPASGQVKLAFPVAGGAMAVGLSPDDQHLYATSGTSGQLVIFQTDGLMVRRVTVGRSPFGLAISYDGRLAYLANQDSDDVSVVDLVNDRELQRVPVGKKPFDVLLSEDGARLWVSLHGDNAVAVYDTSTMKEIARAPVGMGPCYMCLDPSGKYLYAADYDSDDVAVLDRDSLKEVARVKAGDGAYGIAAARSGQVYVSNVQDGSVTIFTRDNWTAARDVSVGARPYGLALSPAEDALYVALQGESRISVRDPATLTELSTIPTDTPPHELLMFAGAAPRKK